MRGSGGEAYLALHGDLEAVAKVDMEDHAGDPIE